MGLGPAESQIKDRLIHSNRNVSSCDVSIDYMRFNNKRASEAAQRANIEIHDVQ